MLHVIHVIFIPNSTQLSSILHYALILQKINIMRRTVGFKRLRKCLTDKITTIRKKFRHSSDTTETTTSYLPVDSAQTYIEQNPSSSSSSNNTKIQSWISTLPTPGLPHLILQQDTPFEDPFFVEQPITTETTIPIEPCLDAHSSESPVSEREPTPEPDFSIISSQLSIPRDQEIPIEQHNLKQANDSSDHVKEGQPPTLEAQLLSAQTQCQRWQSYSRDLERTIAFHKGLIDRFKDSSRSVSKRELKDKIVKLSHQIGNLENQAAQQHTKIVEMKKQIKLADELVVRHDLLGELYGKIGTVLDTIWEQREGPGWRRNGRVFD